MLSAERLSQFYSNFYPLLAADEDGGTVGFGTGLGTGN